MKYSHGDFCKVRFIVRKANYLIHLYLLSDSLYFSAYYVIPKMCSVH